MLLLMCRKNLPVLSDLPYKINIQIILGGMTLNTIIWLEILLDCLLCLSPCLLSLPSLGPSHLAWIEVSMENFWYLGPHITVHYKY